MSAAFPLRSPVWARFPRVERFDPEAGTILLATPLSAAVPPGTPFKVRFEEAPLVACRLRAG